MDLKAELKKIIELQETDYRIYSLTQQLKSTLPQELDLIKSEFEEKKKVLTQHEENLKNSQLGKKDQELELASKEEAALKAQGHLYQLKTNKEYQAKLNEIESIKADISVAEENLLKAMDSIDNEQKLLAEQKKVLAEHEIKFKEKESAINSKIKGFEAESQNLKTKREQYLPQIDVKTLKIYEKTLESRGGIAVVPIKDSCCGSCYLHLPHQKTNEIKMYTDLIFCENCVRILYLPDDMSL